MMQYSKDENEPSYDNVHPAVHGKKPASKIDRIRFMVSRPEFKLTAVITIIAMLAVLVVVPTFLEVTRQGNGMVQDLNKSDYVIVTFYDLNRED